MFEPPEGMADSSHEVVLSHIHSALDIGAAAASQGGCSSLQEEGRETPNVSSFKTLAEISEISVGTFKSTNSPACSAGY